MIAIVVINMDRDADRLKHMRDQMDAADLSFERYAALDGAALPDRIKPYFEGVSSLSRGEIGCYASHLDILLNVANGDIPAPVLILEDDVCLCPNFTGFLRTLLHVLPDNWDFVRLSNPPNRAYMPVRRINEGRALCRYSMIPPSTGASLVSRGGAHKFSRLSQRAWPIDQDLRRDWLWGIDTYGVAPAPVEADVLQTSTIAALSNFEAEKRAARDQRLRARQARDVFKRQSETIKHFGWRNYLSALWANVAVRQMPKAQRARYLETVAWRAAERS